MLSVASAIKVVTIDLRPVPSLSPYCPLFFHSFRYKNTPQTTLLCDSRDMLLNKNSFLLFAFIVFLFPPFILFSVLFAIIKPFLQFFRMIRFMPKCLKRFVKLSALLILISIIAVLQIFRNANYNKYP